MSLEKKLATRAMTMSVELGRQWPQFFKFGDSDSCACGCEESDDLRDRSGEIGRCGAVVGVLALGSLTRYFFGHARESRNASEPLPARSMARESEWSRPSQNLERHT